MSKEKLEKLLSETENYAYYNLQVRTIIEGHLKETITEENKLHYEKQISFLTGRAMGLFVTAYTLREILGLEIPNDGNYQICFKDVLK